MKFSAEIIPLPSDKLDASIREVQDAMRERLANGEQAFCSCCGGDAKVYARAFSNSMLRVLMAIGRAQDGLLPLEITSQTLTQGDTGKIAAWGFITKADHDHKWRITDRGRRFLAGSLPVAHRVLIYQNRVIGFDHSRLVTATDISKDFDLDRDVMSASAVRGADLG